MMYSDRIGTVPNPSIKLSCTINMCNHLRQDLPDYELRQNPHFRSHSEPVSNTSKNTTHYRRRFTADNEITHVSDSEEDLEVLPLSATSQSTFQTKLNSVLPTFTMEEDYLDYNGSGTVQSQLSNENFHSVDFALGGDEKYFAGGGVATRKSNPCSSLLGNDGLQGNESERGINADYTGASNFSDDDVILIGSDRVITEDCSSGINSELERNIDLFEDDTTEELEKAEMLKDVVDSRILSPIHEQKFDPSEIDRCSTPIVDETVIKSEKKSEICGGKLELVSSVCGGYVKLEPDTYTDVKLTQGYVDQKESNESKNIKNKLEVKRERSQSEAMSQRSNVKQIKKEDSARNFVVLETKDEGISTDVYVDGQESGMKDVGGPTTIHDNKQEHRTKDERTELPQSSHDSPSLRVGVKSLDQENKLQVNPILKRKRIASKPLSAIINTPKTRVGLSKRIKVEPLHEKIKRKN